MKDSWEFDSGLTVFEARNKFFKLADIDPNCYVQGFFYLKILHFKIKLPHVRTTQLHDLHHIATQYPARWPGEALVSAWELGSGFCRCPEAYFYILGSTLVGLLCWPKQTITAFKRGLKSKNLFRKKSYRQKMTNEEILKNLTLGKLRQEMNLGEN